ncbi:TRAP transporter large permease subunit, partial [Brucella melitensis]|uniref:TRAP transporter large permease subunit n=1 Tax=Brucella melitensis TaxID=29459 RepID=UPI002264074C
ALLLAIINGRLTLKMLTSALYATTKLSAFVSFILLGARGFSLTFYGVNGHGWVEHLMTSGPGGEVGFRIVANSRV